MTNLSAPLTPSDCDLQDFPFMPLDVARLRDSDLAADETPEACWAAVLLWAASWHQVPAASIPDNDNWIAKQAGYASRGKIDREWARVRVGALRGWVKCEDGRLYHPVVAEKACEAWQAKLLQRWRSECARIKKHNQRHKTEVPQPDFDTWIAHGRPTGQPLPVPGDSKANEGDKAGDIASKRQGEGQGQRKLTTSVPNGTGAEAPPPVDPVSEKKKEIWHSGKALYASKGIDGERAGKLLGKMLGEYTVDTVLDAVRAGVREQPPDPTAYLTACCQRATGERAKMQKQSRHNGFDETDYTEGVTEDGRIA
jgi:hypothetical protein